MLSEHRDSVPLLDIRLSKFTNANNGLECRMDISQRRQYTLVVGIGPAVAWTHGQDVDMFAYLLFSGIPNLPTWQLLYGYIVCL